KGGPSNHRGLFTILTKHKENQLVRYCINMQQLGFGLTKSGVNHCIMEIIHYNKQLYLFGDKGPFNKLKQIINKNSLTATQIWNMDETEFVLVSKLEKVIAKKGSRQVHKVAYRNSHEHILVALTISATGLYISPLVIYKVSVYAISGLLQSASPKAVMGFTDISKVVTKYTFAKLFGPAFIETYALSAICNAFKATEIWLFNLKTISPNHLNPSLATEQFDIVPFPSQSSKLLILENKMLKNEIESLKVQLTATQKELGTYKSPGTSFLYSVFKYIPYVLQAGPLDTSSINQQEPGPFPKKRTMLPFA
ncbi:296_t:CDS:2, partial [Cetraspora pellucida]